MCIHRLSMHSRLYIGQAHTQGTLGHPHVLPLTVDYSGHLPKKHKSSSRPPSLKGVWVCICLSSQHTALTTTPQKGHWPLISPASMLKINHCLLHLNHHLDKMDEELSSGKVYAHLEARVQTSTQVPLPDQKPSY